MRMSRKRLKLIYAEYLHHSAKGFFDKDESKFSVWINGHNHGMTFAYGFALGYSEEKIETDLYYEKKRVSSMLDRRMISNVE